VILRIITVVVIMGIGYWIAYTPSAWNEIPYLIPFFTFCLILTGIKRILAKGD